jgi:predicted alpha/beta superfamily hydrolase
MTRWLFVVCTMIFSYTAIAQQNYKADSLVRGEMYSSRLLENRRFLVHLPINYFKDSNKTYPVMYVLDGTSQDQQTTDKVSVLANAGLIPECIVVGIPNTSGNRNRDQTPPFMRTDVDDSTSSFGKADVFLDFIELELIPHIDSLYRSSGYKTISGHSRGALFVFYTLLQKPELFNARFCYSAPIWRFENIMIRKIDSLCSGEKIKRAGFLFFSAGQNENENIVAAFHKLRAVLEKRKPKKLVWSSHFTPHANHQENPQVSTSKGLAEWGRHEWRSGAQ